MLHTTTSNPASPSTVEPRDVRHVVRDPERGLGFAPPRSLDDRRGGVDGRDARPHSGEPAREIAVSAGQIEDAQPGRGADQTQQRRIDQRPMPEVALVALLLVVPGRQVLPRRRAHRARLHAVECTPRVSFPTRPRFLVVPPGPRARRDHAARGARLQGAVCRSVEGLPVNRRVLGRTQLRPFRHRPAAGRGSRAPPGVSGPVPPVVRAARIHRAALEHQLVRHSTGVRRHQRPHQHCLDDAGRHARSPASGC